MICQSCRATNADSSTACRLCGATLDWGDATLPVEGPGAAIITQAGWAQPAAPGDQSGDHSGAPLQTGTVLAGRYEILQLLGEGGMGAVYRAQDRELGRIVALKVIRPELARNAQVLQRFKQEIILARQVTHRNVIRIFDLGQAEGVRFITMEFIEGANVGAMLALRGKLPAAEAAALVAQVARGLEAAHNEGVVHRDLKPQNIMVDAAGKASVMDFGIARSMYDANTTRTGMLMGTPAYMSPEQALGRRVDARSDLYTLGIILYELLTGKPPFTADNPMAALVRRIQEKPVPPVQMEPSIPKPLNDMVLKMLATKPEERYQSAGEILADLEAWESPATRANRGVPLKYAALALAVVAGLGLFMATRKSAAPGPAAPARLVKVLVADFQNSTADSVLDGTLEPTFALALEGASFISSYSRGDARKVVQLLQPGATQLNETLAVLVAKREDINYVVTGTIGRIGGTYRITARALDKNGRVLVEKSETARNKSEVLAVAGKVAVPIRKALGDTNPKPATEAFSAGSLEAAQAYARGQELQWDGNYTEAIRHYEQAIAFDSDMGRAYTGLAVSHRNLHHYVEAQHYFEEAMSRTARMTEREQYRTRGAYYLFVRNYQKAMDEFHTLTTQYPADDAGALNWVNALFYGRNFADAYREGRRLADNDPRKAMLRNNAALYAMYAGQFDDAIRSAGLAIRLNPNYTSSYVAKALSQFALGQIAEADATYHALETVKDGASQAAIGLADLALYEGRNSEAIRILEQGGVAESDEGVRLTMLAAATRNRTQSAEAANRALRVNLTPGYSFAAAWALLEAGQEAKALGVAGKMGSRLEPEPRAYSKLVEGGAMLLRKRPQAAVDAFQQAQKLADTWIGRLLLGRAYLEAGEFTGASSEFDACEKRKAEATSVFLDDIPSFRYYPQIYYYRGRALEGLKSASAGELYQTFLQIKANADEGDPMISDARKRVR